MGCVVWVQLETLGAYSVAVLVNIKKRHHEAAEAFGVAHGKGPGEANGSNPTWCVLHSQNAYGGCRETKVLQSQRPDMPCTHKRSRMAAVSNMGMPCIQHVVDAVA